MTPAEWADRYLAAQREGSLSEAARTYAAAVYDLSYRDARVFAELIEEKN